MPTLNGKTYEMQYLTDEETAVINAMRKGGKVEVNFFRSDEKKAKEHVAELSRIAETTVRELTTECGDKFDSYEIHIGKHTIYHFIDK